MTYAEPKATSSGPLAQLSWIQWFRRGKDGVPSIARHSEPDPICQGTTDQLPCLPCRLREGANREILGIIVSYKVKVKLVVSRGG